MLIAVTDLASAAAALDARYGLTSIAGGRHPGWGTANRIVPLGDAYVELVAVDDGDEAARSPFGRWVAAAATGAGAPLGWAVRTGRLADVAERLGLEVGAGSRVTAAGRTLRWRLAGVDRAAAEPALPFFIAWEPGTPHPGGGPAARGAGVRIARLELDGDADRLAAWLGPHDLPVAVRPGRPAVRRVVLASEDGEIVLGTG